MAQNASAPDPLPLDYQPATKKSRAQGWWGKLVLQLLAAYFLASIVTLPFIDVWWIGELPPLALVQLPKTELAKWLQSDVVMPAIRAMGLSRGSPSPDHILSRPYALAIAYVLVLGVVLLVLRMTKQITQSSRLWLWNTLAAAVIDFACTLWMAGGPGLTIY
jgi:hypothetical protein